MKLANKPCYPCVTRGIDVKGYGIEIVHTGLTFKERLIIALASNPNFAQWQDDDSVIRQINARDIIQQADAILAELGEEK